MCDGEVQKKRIYYPWTAAIARQDSSERYDVVGAKISGLSIHG